MYEQSHGSDCQDPCRLILIRPDIFNTQEIEDNFTRVNIWFEEHIKVTDEVYAYTWVSLVAEMGSYVGFFLGLSVVHVSTLLDIGRRKVVQCLFRNTDNK